jgi:hypothetical protein
MYGKEWLEEKEIADACKRAMEAVNAACADMEPSAAAEVRKRLVAALTPSPLAPASSSMLREYNRMVAANQSSGYGLAAMLCPGLFG